MEGFFERRECSPEEQLLYCVLETYITDLKLAPRRRNGHQRMQFLLEEARSNWTAELCMLLDINRNWFVESLEKLALELGYEHRI